MAFVSAIVLLDNDDNVRVVIDPAEIVEGGVGIPITLNPGDVLAEGANDNPLISVSEDGETIMVVGGGMLTPVAVATTGNIDLATGGIPEDSLTDSVTVEVGQRVLVWQQDEATEIGIYIVQSGAWTRAPDMPEMSFVNGSSIDGITVATSSLGSVFSGAVFSFLSETEAFIPVAGGGVQTPFNFDPQNGIEDLAVTCQRATSGSGTVFPDSDPHVVGAGYWNGGVLTRSSG